MSATNIRARKTPTPQDGKRMMSMDASGPGTKFESMSWIFERGLLSIRLIKWGVVCTHLEQTNIGGLNSSSRPSLAPMSASTSSALSRVYTSFCKCIWKVQVLALSLAMLHATRSRACRTIPEVWTRATSLPLFNLCVLPFFPSHDNCATWEPSGCSRDNVKTPP